MKQYISEAERKIRLTNWERKLLYGKLLEESGLRKKYVSSVNELSRYCETLIQKYIIKGDLESTFPGCKRICNLLGNATIMFNLDFGMVLPNLKTEEQDVDIVEPLNQYVNITFESIPIIFEEESVYRLLRDGKNNSPKRLINILKSKIDYTETTKIKYLLSNCIQSNVELCAFLHETACCKVYSKYHKEITPFGKFYNLGQLYDYNHELAFRYKYEVLGIVDPETSDEEDNNNALGKFKNDPSNLDVDQNIVRLRSLLYNR